MNTKAYEENSFDSIESAIADIAAGKMVIVTDDESRENEGDLVMAAEKVTPQAVNEMALHARGLICVPMLSDQLRRLGINSMASENRESQQTDFAVSVDAAEAVLSVHANQVTTITIGPRMIRTAEAGLMTLIG